MSNEPVTMLILIRKKDGMSTEEFRAHYEGDHIKQAVNVPGVLKNIRRYLKPVVSDRDGRRDLSNNFDVITEVTFENREAFERAQRHLAEPDLNKKLQSSEDELFQRDRLEFYTIEVECVLDREQTPGLLGPAYGETR